MSSPSRLMSRRGGASRLPLLAAVTALGISVAGCSGATPTPDTAGPSSSASTPSSTTPSTTHNQADVTFAQQMIPHHRQAIAMAQLATTHQASPPVAELAGRIQTAQQPEIDQMTRFLRAWNAPLPTSDSPRPTNMTRPSNSTMPSDMPGMGHDSGDAGHAGMGSMPGMMSPAQMSQLEHSSGPAFDKQFLQLMISHHQGAVSMAKTELADGTNPDAQALARRIIDDQQREIAQMRTMLGG